MSEEPSGSDSSFEERLNAARSRRSLDGADTARGFNPNRAETSALGIGLRVGIELVAALLVAMAIGYGLDRLFGTKPFLTIAFVPLGGAAGVWNVWRVFAPKG